MSILNVAQKNSVAKQVANILSRGTKQYQPGKSKYNPVYHFDGQRGQKIVFTSVKGHIFAQQLPEQTKLWGSYDNSKILKRDLTPIIIKVAQDNQDVVKNLQFQARRANELILWLDCDRQGQAIAYEVIQICLKVNRNLRIRRARFSALTPTDIWNANNNLVQPNQFQADAVGYRSQIDFRLGCTFSRYQTLSFRKKYTQGDKRVLSYGPCQMPTLGFVVQRYLQIKNFKPQPYWAIKCFYYPNQYFNSQNQRDAQVQPVQFKWQKRTLRDKRQINRIFVSIFHKFPDRNVIAKIRSRQPHEKKKYRPFPLTTVTLQKIGTDKLKMSSGEIMQIAQKLYHKGFISYPRTETNSFPKTMNLKQLIKRIEPIDNYQNYVRELLDGGKYQAPKAGKNDDNAHSPIHPVKKVSENQLNAKQWKVYDLICRHFLACCSKDAVGQQFQIIADVGGQTFKASYLTVKQRNYLQIYVFQRWNESHFGHIPNQFEPLIYIQQAKTTPPGYLTESDLITLMERNQIGTDATIHQHIKTIQDRQYAIKAGSTFKPTTLGVAIISAYRKFDIQLPQCQIRRMIQQNMNRIANRQISKLDATIGTLQMMVPIYERLMQIQRDFIQAMSQAIADNGNLTNINFQQRGDNSNNASSRNNFNQTNSFNQPNNHNQNNVNRGNRQNNQRGSSNQNSMIARQNIKCYKCNQQGHYANNCPNGPDKNQGQTNAISKNLNKTNNGNKNANNGISNSENRCFKCNQPGHFSRDCPNGPNNNFKAHTNNLNNQRSFQQNGFRNGVKCYKCNQQGHFASDCSDNINQVNNNRSFDDSSNNRSFNGTNNNRSFNEMNNNRSFNGMNNNKSFNDSNNNSFVIRCYKCDQEGHLANNCKNQGKKDQNKNAKKQRKASQKKNGKKQEKEDRNNDIRNLYIRPIVQPNQTTNYVRRQESGEVSNQRSMPVIPNNRNVRQIQQEQSKNQDNQSQNQQTLNVFRVQRDCAQPLSWIQKEMVRQLSYCTMQDIKCIKCKRKGHYIMQCPLGFTMPIYKQQNQSSRKKKGKNRQTQFKAKQKPTAEQRSMSVSFESASRFQPSNGFHQIDYKTNYQQNPTWGNRSNSWESSGNNSGKKKGKKKQPNEPCQQCGNVGRHPRGSSCSKIKRKSKKATAKNNLQQINQESD